MWRRGERKSLVGRRSGVVVAVVAVEVRVIWSEGNGGGEGRELRLGGRSAEERRRG